MYLLSIKTERKTLFFIFAKNSGWILFLESNFHHFIIIIFQDGNDSIYHLLDKSWIWFCCFWTANLNNKLGTCDPDNCYILEIWNWDFSSLTCYPHNMLSFSLSTIFRTFLAVIMNHLCHYDLDIWLIKEKKLAGGIRINRCLCFFYSITVIANERPLQLQTIL